MSERAAITGTGSSVPDRILTNAELEKTGLETNDAWIVERTGIRERRIAGPADTATTLAEAASRRALEMAFVDPASVDLIVCGTVSAEHIFPSCAAALQGKLGATGAFAFDLSAACAGSIYALSVAQLYVQSGASKRALVVGVDLISRIVDWNDRATCILFGDGAGAVVMEPAADGRGVLSSHLRSDGSQGEILYCRPGEKIMMKGREVFKTAVRRLEESARATLDRAGVTPGDVKLVCPHQANLRILEDVMKRLEMPMEKCQINIDLYGNTSAASAIIALDQAARAGKLQKGDLVLMLAIGGGMAWGSMLVRW